MQWVLLTTDNNRRIGMYLTRPKVGLTSITSSPLLSIPINYSIFYFLRNLEPRNVSSLKYFRRSELAALGLIWSVASFVLCAVIKIHATVINKANLIKTEPFYSSVFNSKDQKGGDGKPAGKEGLDAECEPPRKKVCDLCSKQRLIWDQQQI